MTSDFERLIGQLTRFEGQHVRVLYLGVLADGRLPLPQEANTSGLKIRWSGTLSRIRCFPPLEECRRFGLRPQRLLLRFDRGVRMVVAAEQVVGYRAREDVLHIHLRQGRALHFLTRD